MRVDNLRRYSSKLRERALDLIGRTCVWCGTDEHVHMAHVRPTKLAARLRSGRGKDSRYKDVIKNPECYRPMCRKHNLLYDKLVFDLMDAARGIVHKEEPIPF